MKKNTELVEITCDMCGKKIDCCKNSFELKFEEPDPTYGHSRSSIFDFCSPECLAIFTLSHFNRNEYGNVDYIKKEDD